MAGAKNILYIDDEANNLVSFKSNFRKHFEIFLAQNISEAQTILAEQKINVIIADQRMSPVTGIEFFSMIKDYHPLPVRMILTGYTDIPILTSALSSGLVYQYLVKPINELELFFSIERAIEVYNLRQENSELKSMLSSR